jgi:predicted aconitase
VSENQIRQPAGREGGTLTIVRPAAVTGAVVEPVAPSTARRSGRDLLLLDNSKRQADNILAVIGDIAAENGWNVVPLVKPNASSSYPADALGRAAVGAGGAVAALAD